MVEEGQPEVEVAPRVRYTLGELLAVSDYAEVLFDEDREWLDAPASGKELL